ncbi:hypothetical protein SDC9_165491 [bioreactor metagenome]|uniref:Uncharacterized protein n=1 Tax=bioreactor metagenome TaxID=1076179 RepID=A0A645G1Q8_9ZZZZ
MIYTDGNSLSKITDSQSKIQTLRQETLEDALQAFIETVRTIGLEDEAVLNLIKTRLKEVDPND